MHTQYRTRKRTLMVISRGSTRASGHMGVRDGQRPAKTSDSTYRNAFELAVVDPEFDEPREPWSIVSQRT